MARSWLTAAPVALLWLYEGLWCKVFPGREDQRAIVAGVPFLPAGAVTPLLVAIGLAEAGIGVWALSGWRPHMAAVVQTAVVATVNLGGLLWGSDHIPEPARLVIQDIAFIALVWMVAAQRRRPLHQREAR
ncbi:DoxX-like family protein [Planotetraspora sp. A-T 1434]|uniref:DoxX-like family protein n=1 Tax=Planotetraspora sp. A-T 1434 TaxID=2979219 RepID=UPI0021BFB59D|nr:DoxX-like family protein [Planotetraspora sp. A-T 1434]MCT9930768.1 DoxX-like family protein [Planotetraspora sp. A-T 1434]